MPFFRRAIDLLLSRDDQKRVVAAIGEAERKTSGEIKIHVETRCKAPDGLSRARELFRKHGMHKVAARNGVLVYVAVEDHKFALFGDAAIAEKVAGGVQAALRNPDILRRLSELSADPLGTSPTETAAFMKTETERWSAVVRSAGVKPE